MRAIVVFASLMAVALARPDVSHLAQAQGYQYTSPSAGGSSSSSGGGSIDIRGNAGAGYSGSANNQFAGSNTNYNTQSYQGASAGPSAGGFGSAGQSSGGFGGQSAGGYTGNAQQQSFGGQGGQSYQSGSSSFGSSGSGSGFGGSQGSGFGGSSGSSSGFGGASSSGTNLIQGQSQSIDLTGGSGGGNRVVYKPVIKQGEPIITKNFYVHAAPEEDENVRVEEKVQVVRPQKSYKIIFIKAPSGGSSYNAANYPVFPQNEEKTIVYVLSKKDEGLTDLGEIPTPPPAVTHKPEVYFIKYKTKQEAAQAVANIQSQYKDEAGASNFADAGNFGSTGAGNFAGSSGASGNFAGSSGSAGNYAGSSGSAGNFAGSSSGSSVQSTDYRVGEDDDDSSVDIASFLPSAAANGGNGAQSANFQATSSQTAFGPSGGQVAIQSSSFGPSGGATISHQSTGIGGGNEIVPQTLVHVDDEAAFAGQQQQYLPPNCSNC